MLSVLLRERNRAPLVSFLVTPPWIWISCMALQMLKAAQLLMQPMSSRQPSRFFTAQVSIVQGYQHCKSLRLFGGSPLRERATMDRPFSWQLTWESSSCSLPQNWHQHHLGVQRQGNSQSKSCTKDVAEVLLHFCLLSCESVYTVGKSIAGFKLGTCCSDCLKLCADSMQFCQTHRVYYGNTETVLECN